MGSVDATSPGPDASAPPGADALVGATDALVDPPDAGAVPPDAGVAFPGAPCRAEPVLERGQHLAAPGSFTMGDPAGGGGTDENQPHPAEVDHELVVQVAEVTRDVWLATLNDHVPAPGTESAPGLPVTGVSWYAALQFANMASVKDGFESCYFLTGCHNPMGGLGVAGPDFTCDGLTIADACSGWRLPTEIEWEYVARAGGAYAPADPESEAFHAGNSGGVPHEPGEVGGTHPWDLVDVLGNVAEWTFDCYKPRLGVGFTACDPTSDPALPDRVVRGGGFTDESLSLSMRRPVPAAQGDPGATPPIDVGFRLVRTPRGCGGTCSIAASARSGHVADTGLRFLAPPLVFPYSTRIYPFVQGIGVADTSVLIGMNIGDGTPSDKLHLRLLDLNGGSPRAEQPDLEVREFQPSIRPLPLRVRPAGASRPEFAVVATQKHDYCLLAGEDCATFVQRIDPGVPLTQAPPVQVLHRRLSGGMPAFSLEGAGREDLFGVLATQISEAEPPQTPDLRLWMYQVRTEDIVPAATFAEAPDGRVVPIQIGCPATAAGTATSLGGGRLLVVSDRRADCDGDGHQVALGTYLTVLDLDGRPVVDVPERLLGAGTFRVAEAHAPLVVLRDKLYVVLHDPSSGVPTVFRYDVAALIASGDAPVEPDAGFPVSAAPGAAEVLNFTATPAGLHFGLRLGPSPQTVGYAQMDLDGAWQLPLWSSLWGHGSGAIQPLPDGRVLVVGSGYWDHTVYAALMGCP